MLIGFATLGLRFDGGSLDRTGLGGSETALICLTRELAKRGHELHVFCRTHRERVFDSVTYHPIEDLPAFNQRQEFDAFVCSRFWSILQRPIRAKMVMAWCHDMLADKNALLSALWQIDRVALLSKFHADSYLEQIPGLAPLVFQTSNGVDMELVQANIRPKVSGKLIYTSRPERGLLHLLRDIFPRLLQDRPDLRLHVCTYETAGMEVPEQIAAIHAECNQRIDAFGDRVVRLGSLTKARLYQEISSSELWLYPTDFPEISCISAMEAQACGTAVVVTKRFALPETVKSSWAGVLVHRGPEDSGYAEDFCYAALSILRGTNIVKVQDGDGPRAILETGFTWPQVAEKWELEIARVLMGKDHNLEQEAIEDGPNEGWRVYKPGPITVNNSRKLVVFANKSLHYDGDSLNHKGLGGSETAIICLARELAKIGHDVHVFCICDRPGMYDGVEYHHIDDILEFNQQREFDVLIAAQFVGILKAIPLRATFKAYWAQGLLWQMGGKEAVEAMAWQMDQMVMVSEYQADSYRHGVPEIADKISVILNGIDPQLVADNVRPKVLGKLIYSSKKERGLLYLLRDIFPLLLESDPTLKLHVCTYDCPGFIVEPEAQRIHDECDRLMDDLGGSIVRLGPLTKAQLYQEISSSVAMLYPCRFEEAGCATVLESQACGTPVITTDAYCMAEMADSLIATRISGLPGEAKYTHDFVAAAKKEIAGDMDTSYGMRWVHSKGLIWSNLAWQWDKLISVIPSRRRPTIAACMIVKNEEADLYRCLRHVVPVVDELHIIDTGSTDRTIEIAERFGAKVRRVEFDNFAQVRNESIRDVQSDWILWIDADEVLVGGELIQNYLTNNSYFEGYALRQRHLMLDTKETEDTPVRLFRRSPHHKFVGLVHEHAENISNGEYDNQISPVMLLPDVQLAHYGYISEHLRREKVSNRNMALLRRSTIEQPERRLMWVLVLRDYLALCRWRFEETGTIVPGGEHHLMLQELVETFLIKFSDESTKYHGMAYPFYQEALAMMSALKLPCRGRANAPIEVAFGIMASAAPGGIPDKKKLEGKSRWYPDLETFNAFINGRIDRLNTTLPVPQLESTIVVEKSADELLAAGTNIVRPKYIKDGRSKIAV